MKLTGFGFSDYKRFLDTALANDWTFLTVEEYLQTTTPPEPFVVLRHDIDRRVANAVEMATIEANRDIRATYYLREQTFDPETAQLLDSHGHEIGYHYEDYVKAAGDLQAAHERFADTLSRFRQHVDVTTVCSHGNPLSPYSNLDMWREDYDFSDYGLLGEAYLSVESEAEYPADLLYLSDTGRDWNLEIPEFGNIRTTEDLTAFIDEQAHPRLYLLVHPCRWSKSRRELIQRSSWDLVAETVKSLASRAHQLKGV